MKFYI